MKYTLKDVQQICVKNLSSFWLPEFTLQKEIGGTIYSVTGAYDGTEALDKKMKRVMAERFMDKADTEINFEKAHEGSYSDPANNQT